jgi:hypothetical protein
VAILEVGLRWLNTVYGDAEASSVRLAFLRPNALGAAAGIDLERLKVARWARVISAVAHQSFV